MSSISSPSISPWIFPASSSPTPSPSSSSMSPPAIMNYYDLFNQLGHHTNGMWVILSIRGAIATIGIVLNLILLWATLKSRKLRSICNWLIAVDTALLTLFQFNQIITFGIAVSGIGLVQISTCFVLQALPLFGVLMGFQAILLIGLERLANILFPIWSYRTSSKLIHLFIFLISLLFCFFLVWLDYLECFSLTRKVLCQLSDITSLGTFYTVSFTRTLVLHGLILFVYFLLWILVKMKNAQSLQSFSKNLFKSLMGLVLLELCGWLPSIFFGKILQLAKLDGIQSNYVAAAFAVVSTLTASANLPMLYAFSLTYRQAIYDVVRQMNFMRKSNLIGCGTTGTAPQAWTSTIAGSLHLQKSHHYHNQQRQLTIQRT